MAKSTGSKSRSPKGRAAGKAAGPKVQPSGKQLVIVESPTKAKTINKYLGPDYVVMASVGHVRDLPTKKRNGEEVAGVDIENDFAPTYEIQPRQRKTVSELKRVAKTAAEVWFATDLDREGEAIAWHLAQSLGVPLGRAKRVVFNAITRGEIQHAFANPRAIDENKVNAQQARRILDRIVGYQVSPLLWKKVAAKLSAGRVQSVAVRLVVERERAIEEFNPKEFWKITSIFATDLPKTQALGKAWGKWLAQAPENKPRTIKERNAWLTKHCCLSAELIEFGSKPFLSNDRNAALKAAKVLGFELSNQKEWDEPESKGPAKHRVQYQGTVASAPDYRIRSVETRQTKTKPSAPFITSSLQQAAASQLGFTLKRTMRVAQQLYEGLDIHGAEGQTGMITYMRTDSTHLTHEAIEMAQHYIGTEWGRQYLPDKPILYKSKRTAQEAHEAIRPTDVNITPKRVRSDLTSEQYKLYRLIWERFLACQMTSAKWNATTILIETQNARPEDMGVFKATGRSLAFDGHYKAVGIPTNGDLILPQLAERQPLAPMRIDPTQHFSSPPPRYTEASLQKKLEEEGIGRPSTYAPIISTIQSRNYVEPLLRGDRRLRATDLGKVVTKKLTEAFPTVMDVAYTRQMELELDKVEEEHQDWVKMLHDFYGPFKKNLDRAYEDMKHAGQEKDPAPYKCKTCGAKTVYRFGKNGRFLSCDRYPDCKYAAPIDTKGRPVGKQYTDIVCPIDGSRMLWCTGRYGPFLGAETYPDVKFNLKLDPKKGTVKLPQPPPLLTDIRCTKCDNPLNLRRGKRGPWLSCSIYPKCRGRGAWSSLEDDTKTKLEKALKKHEADHPQPVIHNRSGQPIGEDYVPKIEDADQQPAEPKEGKIDSNAA